jgi:hypothetical protein
MDFRTAPVRGEGACYEVTEVFAHALTTPRLVLEPVREGHADLVFAHASDARLWTYFPHLRPHTREDLRARYRRWERGLLGDARTQTWENWLCFQREGGAPIGSLQADTRAKPHRRCSPICAKNTALRARSRKWILVMRLRLRWRNRWASPVRGMASERRTSLTS